MINREDLWKIIFKLHFPKIFTNIVRQFQDSMMYHIPNIDESAVDLLVSNSLGIDVHYAYRCPQSYKTDSELSNLVHQKSVAENDCASKPNYTNDIQRTMKFLSILR